MNPHEIAITAATIVALIRSREPRLDGRLVLVVAALVVAGLVILRGPADPRAAIELGLLAWLEACGGAALLSSLAGKMGAPPAPRVVEAPQSKGPPLVPPAVTAGALLAVVLFVAGAAGWLGCTPGARAVAREGAALAAPGAYQPAIAAVLELAGEVCHDARDADDCLVRCLAECRRRAAADAGPPAEGEGL